MSFQFSSMKDFLNTVLDGKPLPITAMEKMEELYQFNESYNKEVLRRWIRIGIKAR